MLSVQVLSKNCVQGILQIWTGLNQPRPQTRSSLVQSARPDHGRVFIGLDQTSGYKVQPEEVIGPDLGLGVSPVSPGLCTALGVTLETLSLQFEPKRLDKS